MGRFQRVRSVARSVILGDDSPYAIAMGAALGMFLAFTPTLGIQMVIAVVIATILRANRLIALAMVWISNPFTIFPLLYAYYVCGALLTHTPVWRFGDFADHYDRLSELPFGEAIRQIGSEVGYPILVGSLVIASIAGLVTYPIVHRIVVRIRREDADSEGPKGPRILESSSDSTATSSPKPRDRGPEIQHDQTPLTMERT